MIEYFPDPYPDEILYSVCARYSDHVRYPNKKDVFRELLGSWSHRAVVEFPSHLGYFVEHLPFGHHYTADWFIDHHTLLPFYGSFLPSKRLKRVREQMIKEDGNSVLHRIVGVVHPKTPLPSWLRYCPTCVEHDRELFGECYWHRLHQLLGIEICPIHMIFLENSTVRSRGPSSAREFISAERGIQSVPPRNAASSPFYKILMDIAMDALYLLTNPHGRSDPDFLRMQYHALLSQRGFIPSNSRIRASDFLLSFTNYYPPELLGLLHSELKRIRKPDASWLSKLVLSRALQHPLRHLLVIHFLGCRVETFFHQQLQPQKPFGGGPWPCLNPVCEYYHQGSIVSYQLNYGTERLVGRFACECGFTYTRSGPDQSHEDVFRCERILSFGLLWEMKLREYWSDLTLSRSDISSRLGIGRHILNEQVIKLQLPIPRNRSWRKSSKEPKKYSLETISWYREQWLLLIDGAPGESRTSLQEKRRDIYVWLYRHDKEWLMIHSPSRKSRQKPISGLIKLQSLGESMTDEDKESRDIRTAEAVYTTARQLISPSDAPKRVTFTAIMKEVPQVAGVKYRPQDYPRTVQALQKILETYEAFALRKIKETLQKCLEERICPRPWEFVRRAHLKRDIPQPESIQQSLDEAMIVLSEFA